MRSLILVLPLSLAPGAPAAEYLMIPTPRYAGNSRLMTFDPYDGHIVHNSYINLGGLPPSFSDEPSEVLNVGSEIWITDRTTSRINRFSQTGAYLDGIGGAVYLDRPVGFDVSGGTVYVSNSGFSSAAQRHVTMFDFAGNFTGFFPTPAECDDVLVRNGELLVAPHSRTLSGTPAYIRRFDLAGHDLGQFSSIPNIFGQLSTEPGGNVLAMSTSDPPNLGLYELAPSGDPLHFWSQTTIAGGGLYGAHRLGNAHILVSSSLGIYDFDPATATKQVLTFTPGLYISLVTVPAPAAPVPIALALAATPRRRR